MHYGSRMKDWITDHDFKQKALAKEFHVTESMMSHYMTGRNEITVDLLVQFARKFNLSMVIWWASPTIPGRPCTCPRRSSLWWPATALCPGTSGSWWPRASA